MYTMNPADVRLYPMNPATRSRSVETGRVNAADSGGWNTSLLESGTRKMIFFHDTRISVSKSSTCCQIR
jgi:hypothetical protein